jgi:hypothetical protein
MNAARRRSGGHGSEQHHRGGQQRREQDPGDQPGPAQQADNSRMGHYLAHLVPAQFALENCTTGCFRHRHTSNLISIMTPSQDRIKGGI